MKKKVLIAVASVVIVLVAVLCFLGKSQEPYEKFPWGTEQEKVAEELSSLGIDYDYTFKDTSNKRINYRDLNFCGVEEADALISYYFGDNNSLNEVQIMMALSSNQTVNDMVKALKDKYGKPEKESDSSPIGIRTVTMEWTTSNTNIKFSGSTSISFLTFTPKE